MTSRIIVEVAGRWPLRLALAAAVAVSALPFAVCAQNAGKQLLHDPVPPAIARLHLQPVRPLPATNRLDLAIGLPLRNQEELTRLLAEIYDPASTNYQHYLTPEQFAARFGPTEQDYQSLINFARTNGLTVTATYPNRALLDVSGNAATIEKVFHVKLNVYQHPAEKRTFYAPDTEPSINLAVPVLHVSGLDNYSLPRPASLKKNYPANKSAGAVPAAGGSGPGGSFLGNDFRAAYAPGVTLDGAGQLIGLVEFDGFYSNDITAYETAAGIPPVPILTSLLNGFNGLPSTNANNVIEVSMDIELVIAMATNLAGVVVFEAGPSGNFDSILASMAASNQIKQFSSSWGIISSPDVNADQIFMNMAAQGQSFFQASGDGDAWVNSIWVPGASPYVTCVGGTTLTMNGSGASYGSETVWNLGYSPPGWSPNGNGYLGSGGGVSTYYSIPIWQQGINMVTNQGSTILRNIPDVAMTSDNIYVIYNNGSIYPDGGGTSASAPLWAAFAALANQQAANLGKPALGFLNPALYAIGTGPNYAAAFHDITNGNNFSAVSPTNYPAVPGFDLCTGWGTPAGQNLINALVSPDTLGIVPATGFVATGPASGAFSPASQNFFLTNSGASSLNWSLVNTSAWLNASATSGTLAAGATNDVVMSLTAAANSLGVGTYVAIVNFTNWNTHVVQRLPFTLLALQPLLIQPATGFTAAVAGGVPTGVTTQTFSLTNSGSAALNWSLVNTSAWLTATGGGTLAPGATNTATVSLSPVATNLASGSYTATVWFTNQTSGGAQSLQFALQVNQVTVQNGGFETGDFTSWTLTNDPYAQVTDNISGPGFTTISPHSGKYFAQLGAQSLLGFLSRTLQTMAGQSYLLSLWLNSPANSGSGPTTPNEFSVSWNGHTLFDQTNMPHTSGWTNLQFIVTATGGNSVLQFGERDDPWYLGLDDVSLTPIPALEFQPTTVMVTNQNLKFAWSALTGLVYQVQFKTDLLQTNWNVLKNIPATNTVVTFVDTNPIAGSPQKFYRLLLLP
jgi:subtilase family serine protease